MLVNFIKMQGLGNDFVVIDLITQNVKLHSAHMKRIADRHLGIGCDQIILIEPPIAADKDFFYRIFNADGTEVEQCGNGARCAARYFYDAGFTEHTRELLKADCLAGPQELRLESNHTVTVNVGKPILNPAEIPMIPEKDLNAPLYTSTIEGQEIQFFPVSMGNPHMVLRVPSVETAQVETWGSLLTKNSQFPQGTNVEFMQIENPEHIRLRVYERGVGETLACGSGACAAAVAGIKQNLLKSPVTVSFREGDLKIRWDGDTEPVYMTGPAISVFTGRFRL